MTHPLAELLRRFAAEGRTVLISSHVLSELEEVVRAHTEMTRFGVAKHLRLLEEANLVVTRKEGRTKLHHLNAVPIRAIHDRWIGKYTAARTSALLDLKRVLEDDES